MLRDLGVKTTKALPVSLVDASGAEATGDSLPAAGGAPALSLVPPQAQSPSLFDAPPDDDAAP
jgi:hypothetical protein